MAINNRSKTWWFSLAGIPLFSWIKLNKEFGPVDRKYLVYAIAMTMLSIMMVPARVLQKLIYSRKIRKVVMHQDPIFIIGFWRSGTTWLHNILSQDERLGYVTLKQALFSSFFLVMPKFFWGGLDISKQKKRAMDNIMFSLDSPEEHALSVYANSPWYARFPSCFAQVCVFFPKALKKCREYCLLPESQSEFERNIYKKALLKVCKTATFIYKGKQLILKDPRDTAWIKQILEVFPRAKFIYLYRNPYDIYYSTIHMFETQSRQLSFQELSRQSIEENVLAIYPQLLKHYEQDKQLIPKGNLIEIKFEDFERNTLKELERIYSTLSLPNFLDVKEKMTAYLNSNKNYKKNEFVIDDHIKNMIRNKWG